VARLGHEALNGASIPLAVKPQRTRYSTVSVQTEVLPDSKPSSMRGITKTAQTLRFSLGGQSKHLSIWYV